MTKEQAILEAFQALKNYENKLAEESGSPFINSKPYEVTMSDNEITIMAWGHTLCYDSYEGKYGIRASWTHSEPVEVSTQIGE